MNTQHTEPAGQLPPDYIDTEHTGSSRELLRIFYTACLSEGGTADEVTLRGLRAAIAADRAQRHPVPPEPGEVQELVRVLHQAADNDEWDGASPEWCASLTRAADLLAQRYPQPVPVSERLPGPEDMTDDGEVWIEDPGHEYPLADAGDYDWEPHKWILRPIGKFDAQNGLRWLPAHALPLPGEVEG